jgi:hypothetical protein
MNPKKTDLEARAEALLKRIQRHNPGMNSLTTSEVRSLLKEIRAIGKMNLVGSLPDDVLARVRRIMQQAVQEARIIVKGASGHGTKNRTD